MEIEKKKERYELVSTCEQIDLDDGVFEVIFNESLLKTSYENHPENIRLTAFIDNLKSEYEKVRSPEERDIRLKDIKRFKAYVKIYKLATAVHGLGIGFIVSWLAIIFMDTSKLTKFLVKNNFTRAVKNKLDPAIVESILQGNDIQKDIVMAIVQANMEYAGKVAFALTYQVTTMVWGGLMLLSAVIALIFAFIKMRQNYKFYRIKKKSIKTYFYKEFFVIFGEMFLYSSFGAIIFYYMATNSMIPH